MTDPAAIYRGIGEKLTRALISGDFELYASIIELPLEIVPVNGPPYVLDTTNDLHKDFKLYHSNLALHRVTDLYREGVTAEIGEQGDMTARFTLHILSGAKQIVEPFQTAQILHDTSRGWRIFKIISSLGHINWTIGQASISEKGFKTPDTPDDI